MSDTTLTPGAQQKRLAAYLDTLAQATGHADRIIPLKNYCTGLLLEGARKSVEPMAARLAPDNVRRMHQSLHHLVADAPWSDEDVLAQVRSYVLAAMKRQGPVVAWIVDDTGFPKKGKHSADEIDRLGSTFKEMAERIDDQMEKLRKSDALRRELIANVSHDLRTPLATLQGYIETLLLKEDSLREEERRNYLETAIKHCERLSKLVSELFELAKLGSDEISVEREPFNLSELVQDVVQKFQLNAGEKSIHVSTNIDKDLPFVKADIGLIERVLENLIENAIHYTPRGGSVNLVLTPQKEVISVRISDTGYGIPEENLPDIFNRFYQLDAGRKGEPGHSGLGLAITKKILELHDRTIEVTSALNSGTTFTFQLPVYPSI